MDGRQSMYEDHPLAAIFPLMGETDLAALADDIDANGLRDPVWLHEGKILDGRNRYRACLLKDIDPRVEQYRGKDPVGFVVSKNLHRRHLTESQRAMVAARIAKAKPGSNQHGSEVGVNLPLPTRAQAADMLGVSPELVKDAKSVQSHGVPELADAVDKGDVSVSAAAEVAKIPEKEQKEAVAAGPAAVKEKAKEQREKKKAQPAKKQPEPILKDGLGAVVPRGLADTFGDTMLADAVERIEAIHKELCSVEQHVVTTLARKGEFWPYAQFGECAKSIKGAADAVAVAASQLANGLPFCVCPHCKGDGCTHCRNSGAWSRHRHEQRAQYGD
jgi:hypothetical protein